MSQHAPDPLRKAVSRRDLLVRHAPAGVAAAMIAAPAAVALAQDGVGTPGRGPAPDPTPPPMDRGPRRIPAGDARRGRDEGTDRPAREGDRAQRRQPGAARGPRTMNGGLFAHLPEDSKVARMLGQAYDGGQFALPELPYGYDAVDAVVDAQTMELHHQRHHQAYVDGANEALAELEDLARDGDADSAKLGARHRDLSFNYGGHLLHTLFFATMGPGRDGGSDMGGEPEGELRTAVEGPYGSFDNLKQHVIASAGTVKGSGWVMLCFDPLSDHLLVNTMNDQDAYFAPGMVPLFGVDVWEHAYYLRYQNRRAEYVENWFDVIDWQAAGELYEAAHLLYRGKPHDEERHEHDH